MKLPRDVDGVELAEHLIRDWDYQHVHQTGSHIKLRTDIPHGHTATIPAHKPLKVGMLNGIAKEIAAHKGVPRDDILRGL